MTFFRHSCAHSPHEPHGHDHSRSSVSPKDPVPKTLRTSFFLLLLLSLPEIGAGEMSLSRGLIADGLHNLLDVAGTLPLFLGLWAARRPPSRRFPYGLGKVETLAGICVLAMILASALATLFLSVRGLIGPVPLKDPGLAAGMALASVAINLLVGGLQTSAGRSSNNPALAASGLHALTDAGLALSVLAGIAGSRLGFHRLDSLAGLFLGILLVRSALAGGRTLLIRLLDGVDPDILDRIAREAGSVPGVEAVGEIRARWLGGDLVAEIRLTVDDRIETREAHRIGREVRHRLLHNVRHLGDLLVHIDPRGESGDAFHRIGAHSPDGLPLHSH